MIRNTRRCVLCIRHKNDTTIVINHKAYCAHHNVDYQAITCLDDALQYLDIYDRLLLISDMYIFLNFDTCIFDLQYLSDQYIWLLSYTNNINDVRNDWMMIKSNNWSISFLKLLCKSKNIRSLISQYIDINYVYDIQNIGYIDRSICVPFLLFATNYNSVDKPHILDISNLSTVQANQMTSKINHSLGIYNVC